MTYGQRLKALRKAMRMTQEELADALHVTASQVSRWEKGVNVIPLTRLQALADILGTTVADIVQDANSHPIAPAPKPNAVTVPMEGASLERMRDDLPVYGTALGASRVYDGEAIEQTMLNTGDILQYVKRPVILNGRADAYGLYVHGQSMEPVHIEGDLILAERKRPARIGDDVVVYLRPKDDIEDDGERARGVLVKRLIRRTASYWELAQFNPAVSFKIPAEDVVRADRVLRLADLLG